MADIVRQFKCPRCGGDKLRIYTTITAMYVTDTVYALPDALDDDESIALYTAGEAGRWEVRQEEFVLAECDGCTEPINLSEWITAERRE